MDQLQDHTHIDKYVSSNWNILDGRDFAKTPASGTTSTGKMNSGRRGEETRVKNISVQLWQRIS